MNIDTITIMFVLVLVFLYRNIRVENFTYPYNYGSGHKLSYKSTVFPHNYANSSFRNKHYNEKYSNFPWLKTPPHGEFKEGFTSVTNIDGSRRFPYVGPSGRVHYGYTNGLPDSVRKMTDEYYFNPLPYYVYEN